MSARAALGRLMRNGAGAAGFAILAVFTIAALGSQFFMPASTFDVTGADVGASMEAPSARFWLGTDENGLSVLSLVLWGSRISLLVGVTATAISMVIGTLVGIAAGHFGVEGRPTTWPRRLGAAALERLTDWFLVIPFLPLVIVLASVLGRSLLNVIVVIGITSWPGTARLVRAQTLAVETRGYIDRARALGAGDWQVMTRHVLPSVMPLVLANTVLTVAVAILSETTLSFLGLGAPYEVTWGSLIEQAFSNGAISRGAWWYLMPPGVCVIAVVLAFTLLGRALETVLDPRLVEGANR